MEEVKPTGEAWRVLLPAAGTHADLRVIEREVIQGTAQLWRVPDAPRSTFFVTRVEQTPHGHELVLVVLAGSSGDKVIEWLHNIADFNGWSIRAHLTRADLIERLKGHGWTIRETILARPKNGQQ